jgi:hypothetical protein
VRVIRLLLSDGEVEAALDLLDQWLEVGSEASEAMKALIGAVTLAASAADQTTMLEYDLERLIRRGVVTPATLIDVWENVNGVTVVQTGSRPSVLRGEAVV